MVKLVRKRSGETMIKESEFVKTKMQCKFPVFKL